MVGMGKNYMRILNKYKICAQVRKFMQSWDSFRTCQNVSQCFNSFDFLKEIFHDFFSRLLNF